MQPHYEPESAQKLSLKREEINFVALTMQIGLLNFPHLMHAYLGHKPAGKKC